MELELTPELEDKLLQLKEKYAVMGQDMLSYIDGLLYADYLTYWDYIHLDVLLNLQTPRTRFPDEEIFIMYHQITELHFKLIIKAVNHICYAIDNDGENYLKYMKRINSYFRSLVHSFEIMIEGMDTDQFLKFRMSLLPASGFQSGQYRMIELASTDVWNLVKYEDRGLLPDDATVDDFYEKLYWKQGATELATGKKTLTLRQFEMKYSPTFKSFIRDYKSRNLYLRYNELTEEERNNPELIEEMRVYDKAANVDWPTMHYKSAVKYLQRDPRDIEATGGTNWQKYLPARSRRVMFFPSLWNEEETQNWGRITMPVK